MIELKFDQKDVQEFIKSLEKKALKRSLIYSTNAGLKAADVDASRDLRERYKLPLYKGNRPSYKAQSELAKLSASDDLTKRSAQLSASTDPISLIHTVVGPKVPRPQPGVPRANRKPTYISVRKGAKTRLGGKFIAKPATRAGGVQVFVKKKVEGEDKLFKEILPSIHSVLLRDKVNENLWRECFAACEKSFYIHFNKETSKLIKGRAKR